MSEVTDLTQPGEQVVYVPGGAVSLQQGQQEMLTKNQLLWQLAPLQSGAASLFVEQSIVDALTATTPALVRPQQRKHPTTRSTTSSREGMAAGLAWVLLSKKKKGRKGSK